VIVFLLDPFDLIKRLVEQFVCWVETAVIFVCNMILAALVAALNAVLFLFPAMPDLPSIPEYVQQGFRYGNYYFPVGYLVTVIALVASLWLAWWVYSIILRWAKAV
jgi:hypothetical protein